MTVSRWIKLYTRCEMCMLIVYFEVTKHGPLRKQKGRESAMVTTFNKKGKCHACNKTGHWARDCYHRKSSMKDTNKASKRWCSLHKRHLHDNSEYRQQQQLNGNSGNNRNNRNRQKNGQHQTTTTTPAHANTVINSGSTKVVENYNNAAASIQGTTTVTSTTLTELQLRLSMQPLHKASDTPPSLLLPPQATSTSP